MLLLCSICIKLAGKPCDTAAVPAVLARSESSTAAAAKRVSLAGAGKAASIKAGSEPAVSTAATAPAAAGAVGGDLQQQHAVQIKLSGLDGLQQELPAVVSSWVPAGPG